MIRPAALGMLLVLALPAAAQLPAGISGDLSSGGVTATGSTALRSLADRAAVRINVRDFGAVGNGTIDDSAAFVAAINAENAALTAGAPAVIYVPAGKYLIKSVLPAFAQNMAGAIVGDGSWKSVIIVDPTYVGDLFSWSDAWGAGTVNGGGTARTLLTTKLGPHVEHLTILGDQAAAAQQNAFNLYDHIDFAYFNDVDVDHLHGRAFYAGGAKNDTASYLRESHIENFRVLDSGMPGIPAFELTTTCTVSCVGDDATDEVTLSGVDIYGSRGPSLVIRNAAPVTGGTIRGIRMTRLRIEGTELNTHGVTADLMTIGDAAMTGLVTTVTCVDCRLTSPYTGYPALRLTSQTAASKPVNISYSGTIIQGGGGGAGLRIDAGASLNFRFTLLASAQTNITVAAAPFTAGPIYIDGAGSEPLWTWAVDTTALQYVMTPLQFGVPTPQSTTTFRSSQMPDNTVNSGNNRGMNSTDWQTSRFAGSQAATGLRSTIGGGTSNQADGTDGAVAGGIQNRSAGFRSAVGGGFGNVAAAQYSSVPGGQSAFAHNYGQIALAAGGFAAGGDAQVGIQVLRGSGATAAAFRLTGDGLAASNSSNNCIVMQPNYAFGLRIALHARNLTTPGADFDWVLPNGFISQDATTGTTAVIIGTPLTLSRGTVTGAAVTATADTTIGCLNLAFTPPTGNASTWHAVARVETVEVQ